MYDRCNMGNSNSDGGNMDIGGAVGEIDTRTIANRIEEEKQHNILSGSKIRRIKQLITKFNNFNNHELNKFNKSEHRKYKHLKGDEIHRLNSRFSVIDDIIDNLETIHDMGFTLYYYTDTEDAKNNDFIFGMSSGQLRGLKVFEPFKYKKHIYKTISGYNDIFKIASPKIGGIPPLTPSDAYAMAQDIKFSLNGFNFTADALSHNLILQYMAEKKRSPPVAVF